MDPQDKFIIHNLTSDTKTIDVDYNATINCNEGHDLRLLLESWELPHLYSLFCDENVSMKRMRYLQQHHINKIFKNFPVGDQAHFEYFFSKWKQQNCVIPDIELNKAESNPKARKLSLAKILSSCSNGPKLKRQYEINRIFSEPQRVILINSIANYINSNGIPYTLTDCGDIERQIVEMFPTERLEYYTTGKRGRLYNKLANLRRALKEIAVEEDSPKVFPSSSSETNACEIISLMRSEEISAEAIDQLWKQCAKYRFNKIKASQSTVEILNDWPEFTKPYGFRFVDMDFRLKFPNAADLLTQWSEKNRKLEKYLQTKVSSSFVAITFNKINELNEDSRNFFLLWALHLIFPPAVSVQSGSKMRKKFTIADSQESFSIIGGSMMEIEPKLKLLKLKGVPIQPRLLVVGDIINIKQIFVYFDGFRYALLNTIKATDICFKLFHTFNLKYTEEATNFYKFVEAFFYNMGQPKSTKIATHISEINN